MLDVLIAAAWYEGIGNPLRQSPAGIALLQACLGLEFDFQAEQICFCRPTLPDFLDRVVIRSLSIGESRVDILLQRHASDVSVNVLRRVGSAEVMVKQ